MKASKEIIAKTLVSSLIQSNSLNDALTNLKIFNLINQDQYKNVVTILKQSNDTSEILKELGFDKDFINYTLFFINYYSLADSIDKSIVLINEKNNMKKEIISSLIYPSVLIILTSIALLFISSFIVPQLVLLNPDSQNDYKFIILLLKFLPLLIFSLIVIVIFILLMVLYLIRYKFKYFMDNFSSIPIIRNIIKTSVSLTFSLHLKEVIKNVPLSRDSISILKQQSYNPFINYLCNNILSNLEKGEHIFNIIKTSKLLSDDLKQTMYIAINSKNMSVLLNNFYVVKQDIIKKRIKVFLAIFIPAIVSFIGVILILMYLLIMMPILNMGAEL